MPPPTHNALSLPRPVWTPPWGYAEGWFIVLGLLVVSYGLQWVGGGLNPGALSWPVNGIVALLFSGLLVLAHVFRKRSLLIEWLGRIPASICAIAMITLLVLIMGLVLQDDEAAAPWIRRLGLSRMTQSIPFLVSVFFFLTTLGLATLKHMFPRNRRAFGFFLNHLGLYIAVLGGVLGSADVTRILMELRYGEVVWQATDNHGHVYEMPLAMELLRFEKEEYHPKAAVVETATHRLAPGATAELFEIDTQAGGRLQDWQVTIQTYYALAMPVEDAFEGVERRYEPILEMGAGPAAFVRAVHGVTGETREGWITCGSFAFPHELLALDDRYSLAMTVPRASAYRSQVMLYTPYDDAHAVVIEVNRPYSVGGWKLYQYSYDDRFGRWSPTSIIECIRDPWLPVVYTGIYMLLAGALYLIVYGRTKETDHVAV